MRLDRRERFRGCYGGWEITTGGEVWREKCNVSFGHEFPCFSIAGVDVSVYGMPFHAVSGYTITALKGGIWFR